MSLLASSRFGGGGGGQSTELENQIMNTVKQDMEAVDKLGQWQLSCYRSDRGDQCVTVTVSWADDDRAEVRRCLYLVFQPSQGLCQRSWDGGSQPRGTQVCHKCIGRLELRLWSPRRFVLLSLVVVKLHWSNFFATLHWVSQSPC